MSAENVTPAPEAEDAVVETPAGQGSRVAEQDDAAVSEAVRRLEQEGDVAADYVEELLDIADLDGDIDIEVRDGRTYVSVVSEDHDERLDGLVGPDGRTLEALQELVRLAVLAATGHRSRLILDVCGHRERRNVALRTAAQAAVERVRAGERPVHLEPMGAYERKIVHDVVAEAVDRVRVEADGRQITLVAGGTKGLRVRGDAALITTAVRNLLDNAIRYSEPRTRVSVGVSLDAENPDIVRIAVVDQGIGIPKEEQERVFERFYRVDKARSRATGGTGLGLSIVKHVAADHGGTVELWSAPGRGSTFTLVLPRLGEGEPVEGEPVGAGSAQDEPAQAAAEHTPGSGS